MSATTPVRFVRPHDHQSEPSGNGGLRIALACFAGVILFCVVILFNLGYRVIYFGRILPGVTVAGVDISGMTHEKATALLQTKLTFPLNGRILFKDGQNVWVKTPAELGVTLDADATARMAYDFGRAGNLLQNINDELNAGQVGVVLPPVMNIDQSMAYSFLQGLESAVDQPANEASLLINGTNVTVQPGQMGRKLDIDATLVYLNAQLQTFRDGEVTLLMQEQMPQVLDAKVQAEAARKLLSAPFVISLPDARNGDPGPWKIQPTDLAPMLRVGRLGSGPGSQYVVQFDHDMLKTLLESIAKQVNRSEEDARFILDEQSIQLQLAQPSKAGYQVNLKDSLDQIQKAVGSGQQSASLNVTVTQPKVLDTATSQQLGIIKLISSQTTYFFGSSVSRKKNIETAASKFNGVLVAPGQIFSMGAYMGDISLDNGFAEALIIYNGKTIKGVGGGVCQVSTTLFRTVFFAGLPVVERHAHAYRVLYYEQGPNGQNNPGLSGFDATVYFPLVDFKFKNDTPYWILMETVYNSASNSLTWKLFSTPDGRSVDSTFSGPTNIVPALPPTITYNPDAAQGSVSHVDYAAEGAEITINRTVTKNNQVWFTDVFQTQYVPWADACEYGPGVDNPEKILKNRGWCQKP